MSHHKFVAGLATLGLAAAGTGSAIALGASAPSRATINAVSTVKVKINRYIQDRLRWQKDTYTVRSGGTLKVVNLAPSDGPHTFSVVKKKDLPRTIKQINNCTICQVFGQAHGIDTNGNAPPKFTYVENGQGTNTVPNFDRAGDSAFVAPTKRASVTLPVTAKKGTTLYFVCVIHPWMQAKVLVR